MSNNLYGEQYDSCSPVAKTISVTLQHLTIDGKTLAGEQVDYSSCFSGEATEKFLLLIKAQTKYTLWFDYDYNKKDSSGVREPNGLFEGLTFNNDGSANANCEILPMFVDDDGNPIRIFAVFKIYYDLGYSKDSNASDANWKANLFNFLKQHLYLLDSIVDGNNNDLKSDLIYFEQPRQKPNQALNGDYYYTDKQNEQNLSKNNLKTDAYFSCVKEMNVSYKRFVSLRSCHRFKFTGTGVVNNIPVFYVSASSNEKTILAGTYDDCEEIASNDLTTPSAYIINSLGETFFSKFDNARKIQNLAGQSVGTDKVLRPMMYVISQS